jgi:hypothetical protein
MLSLTANQLFWAMSYVVKEQEAECSHAQLFLGFSWHHLARARRCFSEGHISPFSAVRLYHKRERNLFLLSSEKMLSYHALPLSPPHQESKPVFPFEVTIYASGHRSLHSSQQCCRPLWHWSNHEVKNMARETDHRAGVNHAGKGKRLCWGKGLCRHESEAFSLRALG